MKEQTTPKFQLKTISIIFILLALLISVFIAGCAQQQETPKENSTPATEITVTAQGWNADTDTPAALVITSEVTEEGAEPATTEYVVVEPNAEPTTVELSEGNYDVAMVYPVSSDGQAFTRSADAQELTLTVEGDNPSLDIMLDQKRALTAEEIQASIDTINASTIEQDIKDKILAAYNSAQSTAEATSTENTSADTAATSKDTSSAGGAAVATSNSGNSGSTSAPAASAPAAPAHQHSWEPVYSTTTLTVCTCCDGTQFVHEQATIARSQAASHEVALGNAHPDECHGNSHISQSGRTQQTKLYDRCSGCGATR